MHNDRVLGVPAGGKGWAISPPGIAAGVLNGAWIHSVQRSRAPTILGARFGRDSLLVGTSFPCQRHCR